MILAQVPEVVSRRMRFAKDSKEQIPWLTIQEIPADGGSPSNACK
jgi:hypothetical protein